MKKLFLLAISAIAFSTSNAQPSAYTYSGATQDTLTNSNTVYAYMGSSTGRITGAVENLGVVFKATKITGTTVGGYAILQSANLEPDGTISWTNHYGTSADTFTIANSASLQVKKWEVGDINYSNYRIMIIGNQTQTVKLDGAFSVRNK